MNSNTVLSKVKALLSLEKETVKFTYAKLADGTIVESATFDVGETVEVISEDGTKTPAPDGTHELSLKDEEGNETLIKVITEGGVIVERENVELEEETIEVEPLPGDEPTELAEEEIVEEELEEEKEEEINLEDVVAKIEEMSYKIEELEKKLAMAEEVVVEEEMEEEDDKKLDGAPVEASRVAKNTGKKSVSYHNSVLSKLYK